MLLIRNLSQVLATHRRFLRHTRSRSFKHLNIAVMRAFSEFRRQSHQSQNVLSKTLASFEHQFVAVLKRLDQIENSISKRPRLIESHLSRDIPALKAREAEQVLAIQTAVAQYCGVHAEDLKSEVRSRDIALPRQIGIYLVRKNLLLSFSEIGGYFGGRDHSTVMHAFRKIHSEPGRNNMISHAVEAIQKLIHPVSLA